MNREILKVIMKKIQKEVEAEVMIGNINMIGIIEKITKKIVKEGGAIPEKV